MSCRDTYRGFAAGTRVSDDVTAGKLTIFIKASVTELTDSSGRRSPTAVEEHDRRTLPFGAPSQERYRVYMLASAPSATEDRWSGDACGWGST